MARGRKPLSGKKTLSMDLDTDGLDAILDDLGEDIAGGLRPAAQAAAQVLYDQVKINVSALGRKTGNLDRSIYQKFSPEQSGALKAVYNISWNHRTAPHGHLVEFGYLQRYRYRPDGMGPMVRPGMDGTKKPGRRATREQKDAYYVTLPTPIQVPAKSFVRRAESSFDQAYKAAEDELLDRIHKRQGGA